MAASSCFWGICFVPLDPRGPKIFGFPELLAGLALLVLAWTIADVRYRFRVRTAPIPLQGCTFGVVAAVGVLTLLTDLWRAEGWIVPKGHLLTPATWQAVLAGLFLVTFLCWAWFAFIRPPRYGKYGARRFARTLYEHVLRGSPTELAVIADELIRSVKPIVRFAPNWEEQRAYHSEVDAVDPPAVTSYANDILLMIADKRFCRAIVESSPATALEVFRQMNEVKKYDIQVQTFAANIVNQALLDKDSFLYHEAEGYESGLIGYYKPLTQVMFGNADLVETVSTLLDPDVWDQAKWDSAQWKAYCRVVLTTFRDHVKRNLWQHHYALYRALSHIKQAPSDLHKLNGVAGSWDQDARKKLQVVISFIKDAVEILDMRGEQPGMELRVRGERESVGNNFYDYVAAVAFEIIFHASYLRSPRSECWDAQHNGVWSELFNFQRLPGPAGKIMKFKLRRLLYKEIEYMERFPNFKGARILGFCLNVMGLEFRKVDYDKDSRALHRAVVSWTKRNYATIHAYNPRVAETCLVETMTYDEENRRIVQTYPAEGLRRQAQYIYLPVNPPRVEETEETPTA